MAGGRRAPIVLMILPFDGMLLWKLVYFLRAIGVMEEAFLRKVLGSKGGRS